MADTTSNGLEPADGTPDFSPRFYGIALVLLVLVAIGFWLVQRFTALDVQRDVQNWQEKLTLVSESRSDAVQQWVSDNFKELRVLADNPSLQLYMTELHDQPEGKREQEADKDELSRLPQQNYLRNLLVFTAERGGFTKPAGQAVAINANVGEVGKSGLALLDKEGRVVVSTLMQDATKDAIVRVAKNIEPGKAKLLDIQKDTEGALYIGFVSPIYSIQGDRTAESQIGLAVGIKVVKENLFSLLRHPGVTEKTLEAILVRENEGSLEYISPLQDGSSALTKEIRGDVLTNNNEWKLLQSSGDFLSTYKDYRAKEVLATSRLIAGTPWVMVTKVDKAEALRTSNQRRASAVTIFTLVIAVVAALIVAAWRYLQSHRAMLMSRHFRLLAAQSMAQEKLLRLVTDHQPEAIYIVDRSNICRFANKRAADDAGMSVEAMAGKTLADIKGASSAAGIAANCQSALADQQIEYDLQRYEVGGAERVIRAAYIPVKELPVSSLPERSAGVLVVEQNITEVVHEREQRLHTQVQLVRALLSLVDKRDPFAANHSLIVSELAQSIASTLELEPVMVDTTRIAGSLMNVGKIIVPAELLTKTSRLDDEEKRIIQDSMSMVAGILSDIRFEGPVVETLRQWQEKWNGSGPQGMGGEQPLVSARIIAVANAFVGMISPRSWRTAISVEDAGKFLMEHADTLFDRRVVVALMHYIDTQAGREWLKNILAAKKKA
jgi:PAS domain S-box-containing protein